MRKDFSMLHPVIASREVTRYILDTFGLHTKKRFGQNFLINESVVRGIAEKAKIGPGDLVLEVGPGKCHKVSNRISATIKVFAFSHRFISL